MEVNILTKPEETNIGYNYPAKHSKLCLVNTFWMAGFGKNEILILLGELNVSDYPTQQYKGISNHHILLLK